MDNSLENNVSKNDTKILMVPTKPLVGGNNDERNNESERLVYRCCVIGVF